MNPRLPIWLSLLLSTTLFAQSPGSLSRLDLDPNLGPFYHGVASGDPLPDAVIIWTRVTTQDASVTVSWKMAADTLFNNVVNSGSAATDASRDYTVKVDVNGLQPGTYYYYQFELDGRKSLIGRTKTAPAGDNGHIRFALVSCADFESGYFNAYEHITFRNDIDAVLHVGDYIYEYGVGGLPGSVAGRVTDPANEIITLDDYRVRYSHYHLDPQLRGLHQQYPFITVWDDHETANNSWYGGAENHSPSTEGDWFVRKNNAKKAYFEWLPVRESPVDSFRAYRKFSYGNLADIIVLDTRLEGRDIQDGTNNQDTNRTLLGHEQFNWLTSQLDDTASQWKILAQQVMMARLAVGNIALNEDQWDGYPQERLKLFNHILSNNIENFVVLTGDIHTSWANELKLSGLDSAGVEFVTTSITTANADVVSISFNPAGIIPAVRWANLDRHGYTIIDITKNAVQADWYFVNTLAQVDTSVSRAASWYVNDSARTLIESQAAAPGLTGQAPLAPFTVDNSTSEIVNHEAEIILIGAYPNPFLDKLLLQFYSKKAEPVKLQIIDMNGSVRFEKIFSTTSRGVNYAQVSGDDLPAGNYLLELKNETASFVKPIVKVH